jgi:hypothetical protein
VSGEWTVDFEEYPYVDANGYPDLPHPQDWCSWCDAPIMDGVIGLLVAKIEGHRTVFPIGNHGEFNSPASGNLILAINDMYESYNDNKGIVVVEVTIYKP